jgi:hypothetical protein
VYDNRRGANENKVENYRNEKKHGGIVYIPVLYD